MRASPSVTVTVTEVSVSSGKKKAIRVKINDRDVHIPVDEAVYAYFNEQFTRPTPTPQQKKRFATLMNLLRAAYLKGHEDGSGSR